ncbi:MAG: acyl carrier protein [Anaeroplasma sp.]
MFEQIKTLLIECANVDAALITPKAILKNDLGIDSLYAVELILELETAFNIQIELEEMEELITVADVVNLVERKLAK